MRLLLLLKQYEQWRINLSAEIIEMNFHRYSTYLPIIKYYIPVIRELYNIAFIKHLCGIKSVLKCHVGFMSK